MKKTLLIFILFLSSCSGASHTSVVVEATFADSKNSSVKIAPPKTKFEINLPEAQWSPVIIGSQTGKMLGEALQARNSIMVLTGDRLSTKEWEDKIFQMVKASSPQIKIVARNRGILDKIMLEHGEIPYRTTWKAAGTDVFGRPYMLPEDHPLKTEWLDKKMELKGAEAILVIDLIKPETQKLRELRENRRGSCDKLLDSIDQSYFDSAGYFKPLLTEINKLLADEFTRQLKEALPFLIKEIDDAIGATESSSELRCYNSYKKMLDQYQPCMTGSCEFAPKLFYQEAAIGMDMKPASIVPSICPGDMGRDYVKEITSAGARATEPFLGSIPEEWTTALLQLKSISSLKSVLSDFCDPSYRRFSAEDLQAARDEVSNISKNITDKIIDATWQKSSGQARVPHQGTISITAKASTTYDNLNIELKDLKEKLFSINKCTDSKRRPMMVTLIDVETSEVYFSGIDFEEQIICSDLAPGTP
ncbi:MAG: hypothetical protein JXR91_13740 [Deltaproteobacteria bacterium]|nr:hypothetical protein [Deltaproteobacteria bacterium]